MPPSLATMKYPAPVGVATDPRTGPLSFTADMSPRKGASPKARTLPRLVKIQYPPPSGVAERLVASSPAVRAPVDTRPWKAAAPKAYTAPELSRIQYPSPPGTGSRSTARARPSLPAASPKTRALPKAKTWPAAVVIQYPVVELTPLVPVPGPAGPLRLPVPGAVGIAATRTSLPRPSSVAVTARSRPGPAMTRGLIDPKVAGSSMRPESPNDDSTSPRASSTVTMPLAVV